MKSSIRFFHPASVFFLLTVEVAFLSWVGSIYGWEDVQNFLSAEGLRWALRYTDDNYLCAPMLASLLILFLGLGLCIHSRFPEACLRLLGKGIHLSRKERRALGMTAVSLGVYVLLLAFLAWGPWTLVRSITGDLSGSPLSEGIWCVTAFGLVLAGLVYGSATDFTGTTGISSAACRGVLPILLRDLLPYSLLFSFLPCWIIPDWPHLPAFPRRGFTGPTHFVACWRLAYGENDYLCPEKLFTLYKN